jgi:hypothetical protein
MDREQLRQWRMAVDHERRCQVLDDAQAIREPVQRALGQERRRFLVICKNARCKNARCFRHANERGLVPRKCTAHNSDTYSERSRFPCADLHYVDEAARGGAAVALLDHGEQVIAARFDVAWLAVVAENTRARRFYARQGWSDSGAFDYAAQIGGGTVPVPARRYEKRFRQSPRAAASGLVDAVQQLSQPAIPGLS